MSPLPMEDVRLLIAINAGTLLSIITFGWKILRFMNRMEFQNDIMWKDYQERIRRRFGDEVE